MAFEPGQHLLHYRIVDKIGEGGTGAVYGRVAGFVFVARHVAEAAASQQLYANPLRKPLLA